MKLTTLLVNRFNTLLNIFFKVNILSTEKSINLLLDNEFSLSRYGDGELNIMMGGSIHFQPFNKELSNRLREVLKKYDDKSSLKIGVPLAINSTKGYNQFATEFWEMNMNTGRMHWLWYCGIKKKFLNASLTRCYIDYEEKNKSIVWFEKLKKLWANKNILVIEGEITKLGFENDLFVNTNSVKRIITKSNDAWSVYEKILDATLKIANNFDLILVSLGPTATILAADIAKKGYRIVDIGHINLEYNQFSHNNNNYKEKGEEINYEQQIINKIF